MLSTPTQCVSAAIAACLIATHGAHAAALSPDQSQAAATLDEQLAAQGLAFQPLQQVGHTVTAWFSLWPRGLDMAAARLPISHIRTSVYETTSLNLCFYVFSSFACSLVRHALSHPHAFIRHGARL